MKIFKQSFVVLLAALSLAGAARADFITVGTAGENRIQTDTRWTRDNVYILSRVIFVDNGATLTIEPGTIVRAVTDTLSGITGEPGTLLIARGGKIIANGTADDPIIFTSIDDPHVPGGAATIPATWTNTAGTVFTVTGGSRHASLTNNDYGPDGLEGNNAFSKASKWGGVLICGLARVAQNTQSTDTSPADGIWDSHDTSIVQATAANNGTGTDYVEGMATASGSTVLNNSLAVYGGTNDADNSGVMRFCSLRYGGFVLGAAASANEINGLTICGAGTGTVLEFIEVFQNRDDGFEWFGGKHDTRFLFSLSNQDDAFDGDEGYRGTHQFWLAAQGTLSTSANPTDVLRSGFTAANGFPENGDYVGQEFTASDYSYDKLMEFDGGEGNDADRLPLTNLTVLNATLLAGNTNKRGLQPRLETQLRLHNSIVEGASTVSQVGTTTGGSFVSLLSISNIHSNYDLSAASSIGTTTSPFFVDSAPTFVEETASQIASAWNTDNELNTLQTADLYTYQGFDPRTTGASALTPDGTFATPTGFVDVDYAGCMVHNNFLAGWSMLEFLSVLPATNTTRPVLTIGASGANPTVTFNTAGAAVKYVIEKSTDGKNWTVLTTVPLSNATTVSHTDTTTTIGSPVLYRAYAL
jgi:hypothetical protein